MIKTLKISLFVSVFVCGSQLFSTDFICGPKKCADQQKTAALLRKFDAKSFKQKLTEAPSSLSNLIVALGVGAGLVMLGKYVIGTCNAWYSGRNSPNTDLLVIAQRDEQNRIQQQLLAWQIRARIIYALIASQFPLQPHFDQDDIKVAAAPAA